MAVVVAGIAEGLVLRLLLGPGPLRLGAGGILLDLTMLASLILLYRRRHFGRRALGLQGAAPARSVGLVFLAVIAVGITNLLWLKGVLGLKQPNSPGITLRGDTAALAVAGLFMCLCAPVTEEIFFRGFLYRALRNRMTVLPAAVIAGVLFGLVHGLSYPVDTLPPRMVFGFIACLLYEETGSLLPGIALHCLIDASGFEVAVTGHNHIVFPAFVLLAIVLLAYAGIRRIRRWTSARYGRSAAAAPETANPA
ncbi:MAG TPA: CPBP family intramembrane glutamic endopeptidase [Solirubrobacteraceae bacterium]|nr:CPBP family intramembrane glutamic endopeptidase [Solirubrobacteraceae bacterium]